MPRFNLPQTPQQQMPDVGMQVSKGLLDLVKFQDDKRQMAAQQDRLRQQQAQAGQRMQLDMIQEQRMQQGAALDREQKSLTINYMRAQPIIDLYTKTLSKLPPEVRGQVLQGTEAKTGVAMNPQQHYEFLSPLIGEEQAAAVVYGSLAGIEAEQIVAKQEAVQRKEDKRTKFVIENRDKMVYDPDTELPTTLFEVGKDKNIRINPKLDEDKVLGGHYELLTPKEAQEQKQALTDYKAAAMAIRQRGLSQKDPAEIARKANLGMYGGSSLGDLTDFALGLNVGGGTNINGQDFTTAMKNYQKIGSPDKRAIASAQVDLAMTLLEMSMIADANDPRYQELIESPGIIRLVTNKMRKAEQVSMEDVAATNKLLESPEKALDKLIPAALKQARKKNPFPNTPTPTELVFGFYEEDPAAWARAWTRLSKEQKANIKEALKVVNK